MAFALAGILAIHGLAHLVGFLVPWGIVQPEPGSGPAPGSSLLAGRVDLGPAAMKVYGLVWLTEAVLFIAAAGALVTDQPWWVPFTPTVVALSLVTSTLSWPEAKIGVMVNLVLLGWIAAVVRFDLV